MGPLRSVGTTPAVLVLALAALLLAGCSPERLRHSVRVLQDIEAGDGPSALKAETPEPVRRAVFFTGGAGERRAADVYGPPGPVPAGGDAGNRRVSGTATVVLVPGVTPRGRDDPRVIAFANTLARAGFAVVVPDLPRMRALQVTADDADPIADAIAYADRHAAGAAVGVAAVSFAVGPAVLALERPAARQRTDFVLTIGGYYDLTALITYITTGWYRERPAEPWRQRPAKRYGKWVFALSNVARIEDPGDRARLAAMARRKLNDADAPIEDLVAGLGPEGQSVHALLVNRDPERTPALLAALPAALRAEIDRLDLAQRTLATLDPTFFLIHDRDDRIIPPAHSEALAAALPEGQAHVYVVGGLDHAQPEELGARDSLRLIGAVYRILGYRDSSG
jgi:pimeloyl-ACP methyl ester carboxylesterase